MSLPGKSPDVTDYSPFTNAERERFHTLLKIAAESPFVGERENALAAATRLAALHGMSLDEAARPQTARRVEPSMWRQTRAERDTAAAMASVINLMEHQLRADKARREAALKEAYARGLDADNVSREDRATRPRVRGEPPRRDPHAHARILLSETSLPLREIVSLTGLDIYEVVGMKLKLRRAV